MSESTKPIRLGFELMCVELPLEKLRPTRSLPATVTDSVKYGQVRSSLAAIGLVEPLAVFPDAVGEGIFQVLDGHLRLMALKELGVTKVLCLISTDDEAYTYNKRVSRLTAVQEHRMIVRAHDRGASVQRLSIALNISEASIRARFRLLNGVCDEAVRLLADTPAGQTIFNLLRKLSPFRQIDVARTMVGLENYSVKLAEAMLHSTPPDQLAEDARAKVHRLAGTETALRLQRELVAIQADTKLLSESYADANLQLAIIKAHVESLLNIALVVRWLARNHPDYLKQFQLVADIKELPSQ